MTPEEILMSTLSNIGYDFIKHIGNDLYSKLISCLEGNTNRRQINNTVKIIKHYADQRQKQQSGYNKIEEKIDDDWFVYWHEKSKLISDEQTQQIWAKILNSEVDSQGSISKRTLDFLSKVEKSELKVFGKLCQFEVQIADSLYQPMILEDYYDEDNVCIENTPDALGIPFDQNIPDIYIQHGIDRHKLKYLEEIELIKTNKVAGGIRNSGIKDVSYFNTHIAMKKLTENQTIWLGFIEYTKIGAELSLSIRNNNLPIEEFMEFLIEKWKHFIDFPRMKLIY
ncbi:MAG: DUF2806 domain-containing protein [Candidatus Poribacteria bacterium]|nr:DUF2806 domain-containing protein [Candidatus Poribacteria bacterium]